MIAMLLTLYYYTMDLLGDIAQVNLNVSRKLYLSLAYIALKESL